MSIKSVDPEVLALLSALIPIDLAKALDLEEQNVFGNFLVAVGSVLLTIAAAGEARKKASEEAQAKGGEEKKTKAGEEAGTKPAATDQAKQSKEKQAEDTDILVGRLSGEQEELRRQVRELERQVRRLTVSRDGKG